MADDKQKYVLFGRVTPENHPLGMSTIQTEVDSPFYSFTLRWLIQNNQIVAVAFLEETVEDLYTLKNLVQERIQPVVDGMSYVAGRSYTVNIEFVSTPHGDGQNLLPDVRIVQMMIDEVDKPGIIQKIIGCFGTPGGKPLELALADFSQTMTSPGETPFYCQRAFDSLLQYFIAEFDLDIQSSDRWDYFWNELDHENSFITDEIVPKAKKRRHGVDTPVTDKMRGKMIREAWIVILKYIDYMMSKYQPDLIDIEYAEMPES